ncbi:hypothetical protein FACS1894170_13050 [Planctomycetales bacterium]|nr:hypothetical protein FACS1894170_13050 [Planctomycetales bacterium]
MTGVDDTVLRINAGVCRIRGKTESPSNNVINDDIFIAFDYQSHLYRFDNGDRGRSLFTHDTYYQVWGVASPSVSIDKSSAANPNISGRLNYIDIQSAIFFVPVGPPKRPYSYLNSVLRKKDFKCLEYQEFPNGLIHIKVELPRWGEMLADTQTYTVDTKNGYTLRGLEHSFGYVREISWENINNTWVPVSYVMGIKKDSRAEKQGTKMSVNWKIDWEQVNEKVDPKYFDLKEIVADLGDPDLEQDIPIYSQELGQLLRIGSVGKDSVIEFEDLKHGYNYLNLTLVTIGGLLVFIPLCKMYYDRRKKRKK